jgi:FkbM family methyltransferase
MYDYEGIKFPKKDYFANWAETRKVPVRNWSKNLCEQTINFANQKRVALDIGAHVGLTTLHWQSSFNHVIAIEPMPDHYRCLVENTKKFNNIKTYNFGICNEQSVMYGAYKNNNSGSFQLLDDNFKQPRGQKKKTLYEIKTCRIDDFDFNEIDLIKIDVEGWELEVIKGAVKTLTNNRPVMMIEFTGGNNGKSFHKYDEQDFLNIIKDLNYKELKTGRDINGRLKTSTIYGPKEIK